MVAGSCETKDHGGVAYVRMGFLEVDKSDFEKIKSKNFKKEADPRLEMDG
jgi:hypothetical protein